MTVLPRGFPKSRGIEERFSRASRTIKVLPYTNHLRDGRSADGQIEHRNNTRSCANRSYGTHASRREGLAFIRYITHPQVRIDFDRPVTAWGLSDVGRTRAARLLEQPWVSAIGRVITSDENKAIETARLLAARLGIEAEVRSRVGENDRSATGPLPAAEFERLADQFFARPHERIRGWESAIEAQLRIVTELADLLNAAQSFDLAVIGHGGVGTLWYCHLAGLPIDRRYDQPSQGHYFSIDLSTGRPAHAWRPIDKL